MGETAVLVALVDLDRAVENGQLLLEQLQIRVDKAQLERNRLAQLLVARGSTQSNIKNRRVRLTVNAI
jgi:GH18 family chitinase